MFKSLQSTVFILHLTPVYILLSVCSLHFTLSLHFTYFFWSKLLVLDTEDVKEKTSLVFFFFC